MPYKLFYHADIQKEDFPGIPQNIKVRLKRAIELRLLSAPGKYGEPLKRGLKGYRKLRVGNYRIIYKVDRRNIVILKIGHRKEI